jgi:hypothetical protein
MSPRQADQSKLTVIPLTLAAANEGVARWHRHHKPVVGHRFSLGVLDETGTLRGVLCAGRPVARMLDQDLILEVNRLATDGCRNACSALYGAARRAARAMGFAQIITYILDCEPGTSLRAAGWILVKEKTGGHPWNNATRSRSDAHPLGYKQLWAGWQWSRDCVAVAHFRDRKATLTAVEPAGQMELGL